MPSIMTIQEDFDRLLEAMKSLEIEKKEKIVYKQFKPEKVLEIRRAFLQPSVNRTYREALGEVVTEYIIPYPPGSPILVPGERMSQELIDYLEDFEGSIVGLEHEGYVNILMDEVQE